MEKKANIIFIHAISQRCGHNYLAKLIQSQTNFKVLIHDNHEVIIPEVLALEMQKLEKSSKFIRNRNAKVKELKLAAQAYIKQKEYIIYKTSRLNSKFEIELFPNAKHIILIRNPKDLFVSYEKSVYNFRSKSVKNSIKKIIRPLYSYYVLLKWKRSIDASIKAYQDSGCHLFVCRYEELLQTQGQQELFDFIGYSVNLCKKINIKNINSSFAKDSERWKNQSEKIGDTTKRFDNAPIWLKWIIQIALRKTIKKLNYN